VPEIDSGQLVILFKPLSRPLGGNTLSYRGPDTCPPVALTYISQKRAERPNVLQKLNHATNRVLIG
jgi:hypothetical protein